mgnify:FL=1
MRVAFLVNHLGISGVNNVVADLVTMLVKHGHRCCVFYFKESASKTNFTCETRRVSNWKKRIELNEFDILHCHGLWPMLNVVINRYSNVLKVTTLHCYCFQDFVDLYGTLKAYPLGCLYLAAAYSFDRIVCLSEDMMHYYGRYIKNKPLSFVYNTRIITSKQPDKLVVEEIKNFKQDGVLIGMNGVLINRKGIDVMIKAIGLLPTEYKLVLVGDGPERTNYENEVMRLGLDSRVRFLGMQPNAYCYLPYYDIYALPSRSEGFPLALLEAAAMGINTVVSDLPIVSECFDVRSELTQFHLDEGAEGLMSAIIMAKKDAARSIRLKQRYDRDYAPERFYENYMKIYEQSKC